MECTATCRWFVTAGQGFRASHWCGQRRTSPSVGSSSAGERCGAIWSFWFSPSCSSSWDRECVDHAVQEQSSAPQVCRTAGEGRDLRGDVRGVEPGNRQHQAARESEGSHKAKGQGGFKDNIENETARQAG